MIEHTSTEIAPWHLIEAEDKYWARVAILRTICDGLEAAVGPDEVPEKKPPVKKHQKKRKK